MEVIVRPLLRNTWSGVRVRYKKCIYWIGPYFTRSGNLYTGLTEEDLELDLEAGTTATRLEKALQKEEGTLSPYSEYWKTFHIRFDNKDMIINTKNPLTGKNNPDEELKYIFLKHHKSIANGFADVSKPKAEYVI